MIAWIEGVLREKTPTRVVVDVAGVGYELHISLTSFAQLPDEGKTAALHVHLVARGDALLLYGFATREEKEVFELLLRANRVGPRLAQTILSGLPTDRLLHALREGEIKVLCTAPGVGKKLAERIVVELRERATELAVASAGGSEAPIPAVVPGGESVRVEVLSALVNLGYPTAQAERVVAVAAAEAGEGATTSELIRLALKGLSR